jgi:aspartate aminotransferase
MARSDMDQSGGRGSVSQQAVSSGLSQLAASIGESPTLKTNELARQLRASGDVMVHEPATLPRAACDVPHGTYHSFPDFSSYDRDLLSLAAFLLDKARAITITGIEFGKEGHLRLPYVGRKSDLAEGVRRIRWALDPASPTAIEIRSRTVTRDRM